MKHSKFIVLLALLLTAVMAFSSCSGTAAAPSEGTQLNGDLNKEEIKEIKDLLEETEVKTEKETIVANLAAWKEYISFATPDYEVSSETEVDFSKWESGTYGETRNSVIEYDIVYNVAPFIALEVCYYKYEAPADPEDTRFGAHVLTHKKYVVYSTEYKNMSEPLVETVKFDEEIDNAPYSMYAEESGIDFCDNTGTLRFVKYESVEFTVPETDPVETYKQYVAKSGYFVIADGTKLVEFTLDMDPETTDYNYTYSTTDFDGYALLKIADSAKTFALTSNGTVLKTFDKGMEWPLVLDADAELNGYKYFVSGGTISILNADYIQTALVAIPYNADIWVLANGDVFVQKLTNGTADDYDYYLNGDTYMNVDQFVIDCETGAVTELELGFVVDDMYTPEANSWNLDFKTESNIASVLKYTKGETVADRYDSVVLNDDMTVKAELPDLTLNHTGLISLVDGGRALITLDLGDKTAECLVEADGSLELMPPADSSMNQYFFAFNGDDGLYLNSFNLTDSNNGVILENIQQGYFMGDGSYLFVVYKTVVEHDDMPDEETYHLATVKNSDGYIAVSDFGPSYDNYYQFENFVSFINDGMIQIYDYENGDFNYYNEEGTFLFKSYDTSAYNIVDGLYEIQDSYGNYRYYIVK